MIIGRNFIGGEWTSSTDSKDFEDQSPSNLDICLGHFPSSTERDVDIAVASARAAFPQWKATSRIRRAEMLDVVAQLIKRDLALLVGIIVLESGKPINEARADVVEGLHMIQYLAGRARMPQGEVFASEVPGKEGYALRKPKGVVACITPWNFPFAIPIWLVASALAEGNTVVFKPSEETPASGQFLVALFKEAGIPFGVLNLLHGYGEQVGWPLVLHPDVDVVLFTGSYEIGSRIKRVCAAYPHKLAVCEMGGKNAVIIMDDARMDLAVSASVLSAFKTAGQRCVSASRILVHEDVLDQFTDRFVDASKKLIVGDPADEWTFMGPMITLAARTKVMNYNQRARRDNATILLEPAQCRALEPHTSRGNYISPFIYQMASDNPSACLKDEVFGPHVAVIPIKDVDDAVCVYNATDYGFALAVITEDYRKARYVQEWCDHGVGYWNLPTIGAEVHLPFGGVKRSGSGMPSASLLIDAVTHRISWTVNYNEEIQLAQGLAAKVD